MLPFEYSTGASLIKKQKEKGYTLPTISTCVCEINNTKAIKRTTNIL